jgi:hypothetical protein
MQDDIEAIIDASKHFKYHEPAGSTPLNRLSTLPDTKKHLKRAIKERIRLLAAAYISLASFVDDDLVDLVEDCNNDANREEIPKAYETVLADMKILRNEISEFDPFELPT